MSEQRGPLLQNLVKLKDMMPKLAKGLARGKLTGGARKMLPTKVCKMCLVLFDRQMVDPKAFLEHRICPTCQDKLDHGWTGIRHADEKRIWIMLPKEHPEHGKLIDVVKEEYDLIKQRYDAKNPPTEAAPVAPVCGSCARPEPEAGGGPETDPVSNPS